MSRYLSFILLLFLLTSVSCSIQGSLQGLYGYQKKVSKQAPGLIQKPEESICEISNTTESVIYTIKGSELRRCISHNGQSLLYLWSPNCKSDVCIPLNNVQKICNKYGWELFIVAEFYDYDKMIQKYNIERPIFGIDTDYYKSNLTQKYLERFFHDLLDNEKAYEHNYYSYFKNGKLMGGNDNLFELLNDLDLQTR